MLLQLFLFILKIQHKSFLNNFIEKFVQLFYDRLLEDESLRPIFVEVAKINLKQHIPIIVDFWESVLFFKATYKGNPMTAHLQLNEKVSLQPAHFNRWLALFEKTIDELYEGEKVVLAKQRAHSIAILMQIKIQSQ